MLDLATYYAFNIFGVDFVVDHGYMNMRSARIQTMIARNAIV
jgi:hypothetical protein